MAERSPEVDLGDAYINDMTVVDTGRGGRALLVMSSDGEKTPGSVRGLLDPQAGA